MTTEHLISSDLGDRLARVRAAGRPDDQPDRLVATAAWSALAEPGDRVAGRLVAVLGAEAALREVSTGAATAAVARTAGIPHAELSAGIARWSPRFRRDVAIAAIETAGRAGVRLLVPGDPEWPEALGDLGDHAPLCLWVRGDVEALTRADRSVAIVGARAATGYGDHIAMEFAAELAGRGVTVVSGAAYGIDGAAHRAALAAGGLTIALLAGGADRAYPSGHAGLLGRIAAAAGAVVSEVPCGSAPTKWRFLQRNRLIAALGNATVVVEAGWRSGSLNTAAHASAMSRPLGAVPGLVTSATSSGCHRLLREFDARCVTSVDEIMELLGEGPDAPGRGRYDAAHTDDTTRVGDALSVRAWRQPADVARRCGLAIAEVESILGILALEGHATRGDGGWRRTPSS